MRTFVVLVALAFAAGCKNEAPVKPQPPSVAAAPATPAPAAVSKPAPPAHLAAVVPFACPGPWSTCSEVAAPEAKPSKAASAPAVAPGKDKAMPKAPQKTGKTG